MPGFLVVAVVIVLVAILIGRSAAGRRRRAAQRMGGPVERSRSTPPDVSGLGQDIAQAVRQALAQQGLGTGSVSVSTTVTTSGDTGMLGIGEVLSVSSPGGGRAATVELDAIGAPRRRVTLDLPADAEVARGDRLYVRLDPARPDAAEFLPGVKPPATRNRLDPLVLQPMLLARGETGKAVVHRAETTDLGQPLPAGASAWRLDLEVSPRTGFPYRAEVLTTVSTPEKVARICHQGAEVAVRYDPDDPKTVAIDVAAMGLAPAAGSATALQIPGFADMGIIARVKAVRERTGLGLAEAKDLAEAMSANPAAFTASAAAPSSATIDWSSLQGLGKIEKIKEVRERTGLGLAEAKKLVEIMDEGGAGGDATAQMLGMLSGRRR